MAIDRNLVAEVLNLSSDDLMQLNKIIVHRIRAVRHEKEVLASFSFSPGDTVRFSHSNGIVYTGEVTKVNRTTAVVKTDRGMWRVATTLLTKAEICATK